MLVESESDALRRFLDADLRLVANLLLRVELLRAVRRAVNAEEKLHKARAILDRFQLLRPSREVLARAEEIAPRTLRALDAIHLATALEFSPRPDLFLCYDQRLADAARTHGLAVVAPGLDEVHEP